ncbi:nitroreductase family protein [Methanoplanus endosymbiosus]|nr:nitroreductase family protein [Methanoplanus endosymbiosus]
MTILKGRRSIRKYKDEEISEEIISAAIEAAKFSPTARNAQPWIIGVVKEKETINKLSELATHGKFIKDAKLCFAVFTEKEHKFFLEDGCAATMQIILGLWSYGVGSCWIAGDKMEYADDVRALLNVPEKYTLVSLIPAGYPADITIPSKKSAEEIYFSEKYSEE